MHIKRVLGGLAPDTDEPMPAAMQQRLQQTWQQIQTSIPETQFNFDFWTANQPRRSTWQSCRAVLAVKSQHPELEVPMIEAIQKAYYLDARNPSDTETLVSIARDIGCDSGLFAEQLNSEPMQQQLREDMSLTHQLGVRGFPSIVLQIADGSLYSIGVNYNDPAAMLEQVEQLNVA